jgi:hypothetical protein
MPVGRRQVLLPAISSKPRCSRFLIAAGLAECASQTSATAMSQPSLLASTRRLSSRAVWQPWRLASGRVALLGGPRLRRALDEVHQADVGEVAEDGGEDRAETAMPDFRLLDGVFGRRPPQVLSESELGRGDRRPVVGPYHLASFPFARLTTIGRENLRIKTAIG